MAGKLMRSPGPVEKKRVEGSAIAKMVSAEREAETSVGLMALYGLNAKDPAIGAADALRGAREMLARVAQLNSRLRGDLPQPMRIGIGIHFSEAIVGAMGPPGSQIITAIGDTVNACKRLEGLTKEYDCAVVVSRRAADMAGLDVKGRRRKRLSSMP